MNKGFFITGTDTDIGKTVVALGLIKTLQERGYKVSGFKPVSAGCQQTPEGLVNEDALQLQRASSVSYPYEILNPYAFEPAIAPHIAAQQANVKIDINKIKICYQQIADENDYVIVEGAGGWLVPINEQQTMVDIAETLNLPVILVAGIKLGCLNHTLMTVNCIESTNCNFVGWIANHLTPNLNVNNENINTLQQRIDSPLLATLPYCKNVTTDNIICYFNEFKI